jgi:nucleoside-diphosphate-sugar epimerase
VTGRVLVTGATGFVGQALCEMLAASGYGIRAAVRGTRPPSPTIPESVSVGDIDAATDWRAALEGVDLIIHAAAHVHDPASGAHTDLFFEPNAVGTRRLAEAAVRAGTRRLIYLSTVKVNGEASTGRAFTAHDDPHPSGVYGTSKWLGEKFLLESALGSRLEPVIIRAPLVYGPGVRANFLRLLDWVNRGRPIPLGAVTNRRSLVSVWNLCDLIVRLLVHPAAPGRVWMVSDGDDRSTPDLIRAVARAMGRRARLVPVPVPLLRILGHVSGRAVDIAKVCDSLQVDITDSRRELGWSPPLALEEGVARTVHWYLSRE